MKLLIVLCLVALAYAQQQQQAQIVRYDNDYGIDNYYFSFLTSDGTGHEQRGQLKNPGSENAAVSAKGQYSWVGPDGVNYKVTYTADENGYQPEIEQGPGGAVPPGVVASLLG
ncbi:insect cuticle protein domain-containing protein [Phthorimaea operculella]|nr:insect cuticle protein domain-containing protein [Phthorimaea operculella]